ncbi:cell wall-binding repeat-containing protein [Clostridium sp. P21]|uniref:Cell wall-binding repeat-containing protein n=1 Tax=Clostridium muellerianum TaxID=2716538 RepID=A0A7Y0EL76_9CLOT|nr:cell wall-binding repeat-containing protein [Clostridium muellerianum]NMM65142.1 cell wall-binding repeat-containing protein [Clostridium muellerianum]
MSKKSTKALASATLMSLVLTTALSAGPVQAAAGKVTRYGEVDRYATAAKVATSNWTTSDNVVLVCAEGSDAYADAVSASALAKKLDAPILLTTTKSLSTDTKNALTTLKAKNVYVVGGTAAVSQSVRDELKKDYTVTELGGANRYETNAKVAEKLVDLGVKADEVIMVGGEGFSDALSVAPIAAAKGQILLLGMNNADYMKPVIDFVNKNKSKVTVVGTENVINSSIYNKVNATNRVNGGSDRFDTNMRVLAAFKDTVKKEKMFAANATGDGYADALVASAVAGKTGAPLILVDTEGSTATTNALKYIKDNGSKSTDMTVIGGTGVVSGNVEDQINKALGDNTPSPVNNEVQSVEAVGLNEIKVVFGCDVDSDSAEDVTNYKVDGTKLDEKTAVASLQDDNRTLLITLAEPKQQSKQYEVSVKDGVITADGTDNVKAVDKTVTFKATEAPVLKSVTAQGRNKLTVEFTAPVDMKDISTLASKFRIKDQNITSYGLETANVPNTDKPLSEIKDGITWTDGSGVTHNWSRKAEFYFNTNLPTGSNTLKVLEGETNGVLCAAGGFGVLEATKDFNVDAKDGKLTAKDITATSDPDGAVWVKFGRTMDKKTALNPVNYELNKSGKTLKDLGATVKLKQNDTAVKITGVSGQINTGANTIYVDKNVRDAYGNSVDDDVTLSFTKEKDETKPTVLSAKIKDSENIRVRFSKDIDYTYATQIKNYTLKDADGIDISSHIKEVKPSTGVKDNGHWDNSNSWDIVMYKNPNDKDSSNTDKTTDWRLTSGKYNITIKSLADTTTNKNQINDFSTELKGIDDVSPKITHVYKKSATDKDSDYSRKVVVYFSEAMDTSTLVKDNFKYKNKTGDSKDLPSSVDIEKSDDHKSVTIKFPSNYVVGETTKDDDNCVMAITAENVKDEAGNKIDTFGGRGDVETASQTIKLKDSCYRMVYDGDDIKVKVQYDGTIDTNNTSTSDFKVAGENPTSISMDKSDLVLTFSSSANATSVTSFAQLPGYAVNPTVANKEVKKVDVLKYYAPGSAKFEVTTDNPVTRDIAGNKIAKESIATVYDNGLAPKTTSDYWYATEAQTVDGVKQAAVVLSFDTSLYQSGVKPSDFSFAVGGKTLKPYSVVPKDNNLVFLFKANEDVSTSDMNVFTKGTRVDVGLSNTSVNISAQRDGNGNYAAYTPSKDDKNTQDAYVAANIDLAKLLSASSVTPTPTPVEDGKVDMSTIECSNLVDNFSTQVKFKLNVTDPQNYTVTVKGQPATYYATTGLFGATISSKVTKADFTATDFVAVKKTSTLPTADLSTVECSNLVDNFSTQVKFKLNTTNPENYTVTVKGQPATYYATTGLFGATINSKVAKTDFTAADFVVTQK